MRKCKPSSKLFSAEIHAVVKLGNRAMVKLRNTEMQAILELKNAEMQAMFQLGKYGMLSIS